MRSVCVITSSRADFGLLRPLLLCLADSPRLRLSILATGTHLSPEFGLTISEIEAAGLAVDERVECILSADTSTATAAAMGLALTGVAAALARLSPDVVVVLGDRFEIFACAAATAVSRIPLAHIHGGEVTTGAYDDGFRHGITKLSHLHFTAAEAYRRRVIQLGERPETVFNTGALGVDAVLGLPLYSREETAERLGHPWARRTLLATFHPCTLEAVDPAEQIAMLLDALAALPDTRTIFTKGNADTHGRRINALLEQAQREHPDRIAVYESLGQQLYFSVMRHADGLVGNSSSGIIEAPSFKIGVLNIGSRQEGRLRSANIIDCPCQPEALSAGLRRLLSPEFRATLSMVQSPFGDGQAARRIVDVLTEHPLSDLVPKPFFDLPPMLFSRWLPE